MAETQLLDAGWGLFRCFRVASASADHANITALTSLGGGRGGFYEWGSGPQIAECPSGHHSAEPIDRPDEWVDRPDRIPVLGCGCGFWGFKSYGELLAQEGYDNSLVYALMRMWGMAVEHETGMRTEFAEITAFI